MDLLTLLLIITSLLCGLTAGLVFTFAVIVMPGIKKFKDKEFIQSFQKMDSIIQNNHPLFMLVWVGSVLAVLASLVIGFKSLVGIEFMLLIAASAIYLLGVQLPTGVINVPLNNKLQTYVTESMNDEELKDTRAEFEDRWNLWNTIRTLFSVISVALFLVLLVLT